VSTNEVHGARRHAIRIVLAQVVVTIALAMGCFAVTGATTGWSALVGGGIGVIATGYMAFALLKHDRGTDAGRIVRSFFLGWAIKVAMTVALLVIAFRSQRFAPIPLLAAYLATFVTYWTVATWGSPDGRARSGAGRSNDGREHGSRTS
jgi:ATP synthase protein I